MRVKLVRRTALFLFGYVLGYHLGWQDRGTVWPGGGGGSL